MLQIESEQFERARRLAAKVAGIELAARHRELLARRCSRLRVTAADQLDALLSAAESGQEPARHRFIELVTTNHTGFFRNPAQIEIGIQHALDVIPKRGRARLWSAAAATGEEPYSLAMAIMRAAHVSEPQVQILATDINRKVLEFAERGEYGEAAVRELDSGLRTEFFEPVSGGFRLAEHVRRLVGFRQLNLSSDEWPIEGPFDVVFCRNVIMYLESGKRLSVLSRVASTIAEDGFLILDPAEHLGDARPLFSPGRNGVYRKRHHQAAIRRK